RASMPVCSDSGRQGQLGQHANTMGCQNVSKRLRLSPIRQTVSRRQFLSVADRKLADRSAGRCRHSFAERSATFVADRSVGRCSQLGSRAVRSAERSTTCVADRSFLARPPLSAILLFALIGLVAATASAQLVDPLDAY